MSTQTRAKRDRGPLVTPRGWRWMLLFAAVVHAVSGVVDCVSGESGWTDLVIAAVCFGWWSDRHDLDRLRGDA